MRLVASTVQQQRQLRAAHLRLRRVVPPNYRPASATCASENVG
jgi:hypothetical protein